MNYLDEMITRRPALLASEDKSVIHYRHAEGNG